MPEISTASPEREKLARWYASRHLETDSGVDRIYYLPKNAPSREIRLLEVNRLISAMTPLEPVDFGVDIGGADEHTLYVLDVTPAQWEEVQRGDLNLPLDWDLDGKKELAARNAP